MGEKNGHRRFVAVIVVVSLFAGLLAGRADGASDGATTLTIERCGGTTLAWDAAVDVAYDVDLPTSFLGAELHVDAAFAGRRSSKTVEALDDLARFMAGAPLLGCSRATVDSEVRAILTARAALMAGASIEALEQRLADLVKHLKELDATLEGAIGAAHSPRDADNLLAVSLLVQASSDFLDGLRYLAGRVRLYGHGVLRAECAAILWRAADATCSGEMTRASEALGELRDALTETSPTSFQRSSLDTTVSRIDSLLGDAPSTTGNAAFGASSAGSLFGLRIEWKGGLTREMGTVPTACSTEVSWATSGAADVGGLKIEADIEARAVGHDDAAARDDDVKATSTDVTATFAIDGVDTSLGIRAEQQRYAFQSDREIPASSVAGTGQGVSDLLAGVARLGLPAAVRGRLASPLNKAQLALQEGRTADAVTALEQFGGQVWKEVFGGTLGESAAATLAAAVEALLPRREETTWTASASTSGTLGEWNGALDAEWRRRAALADSLAERIDSVASLSAKREVENTTVSVNAETRCVEYPGDTVKGYRQSQVAVGASNDRENPLEVKGTAEWTSTSYALDSRKDKRDANLQLGGTFVGTLATWAVSVSGTKAEYPNDPGRDERTTTWEVTASASLARGDLEFTWLSTEQATAADWKMKESLRAEFKTEMEAMDFFVAAKVARATCREDGEASRWTLSWEAGIAADF